MHIFRETSAKGPLLFTAWLLGFMANLGAILSPFYPNITPWLSQGFIFFALVFWASIGVKKLTQLRRLRTTKLPDTFHNGWAAKKFTIASICPSWENIREEMRDLERTCLALLVGDRLVTGGWSRTLVWRFAKSGKKLSPVGSLTGTFFALEALLPYRYLITSPVREVLAPNLEKILSPKGVVIHHTQITSSGTSEVVPENLRHASGFILIKALLGATATDGDRILFSRTAHELTGRIMFDKDDNFDMMGSAFGAAALIAGANWTNQLEKNVAATVTGVLSMFAESDNLWTPSSQDWGREPGTAAARGTSAQWIVVWLLISMMSWTALPKGLKRKTAEQILRLIEGNLAVSPSDHALLPHSFAAKEGKHPIGESLLATGVALYAATIIGALFHDPPTLSLAADLTEQVMMKLKFRGYQYAVRESVKEPFEGYLAWAAVLFGLRLALHPMGESAETENLLSDIENSIRDFEAGANSVDLDIGSVLRRVERLHKDARIELQPNGLYQDI